MVETNDQALVVYTRKNFKNKEKKENFHQNKKKEKKDNFHHNKKKENKSKNTKRDLSNV